MKKFIVLLLVFFLALSFMSCKKDKNATISLDKQEIELKVGESYTFNPTIAEAKDTTFKVEIEENSDKDVLRISGSTVEALKEGTVRVKLSLVSNEDVKLTVTVKVTKVEQDSEGQDNEPKVLEVTGPSTLKVEDEAELTVTATGIDSVQYSSSNTAVVTVENGKLKAVGEGTAIITVSGGGLTKTFTVTVEAIPAQELQVTFPTELEVDGTFKLVLQYSNVEVVSSDPTVIEVSDDFTLKALKAGKATITVSVGSRTKSAEITVNEKQITGTVTLSGEDYVFVGSMISLKVALDGVSGTRTYTSSDPEVATVTGAGMVKGIKPGKVTISLEVGGVVGTKEIDVLAKPTIELGATPTWIGVGGTYQLDPSITNAGDFPVEYKSKDTEVATISNTGLITGVGEGKVRITVSVGSVSKYFDLTVHEAAISISNAPTEMLVDTELQLSVTVEYNENPVEYSSSNPDVVSVSSTGLLKALKVGSSTITVKADSKEVTFTITTTNVGKVMYDFNGGYSNEYLIANSTGYPSFNINSYNNANGSFFGGAYEKDIFFCDKSHWTNATFSDRIFVGMNSAAGIYEVLGITQSGSASWPEGAEYCLIISNSYSPGNGVSYNFGIKQITARLHVGDYVAFAGDFTTATRDNEVGVYFFDRDNLPTDKIYTVLAKDVDSLITPSRLGFSFQGWFDGENQVTTVDKNTEDTIRLQAKWEALNPVTDILINNFKEELADQETYQLQIQLVPADAYFQQVFYYSTNTTIFEVSDTGLLTAKNAGTATLRITDYLKNVTITKEITVVPNNTIVIDFDKVYGGYLTIGEKITVLPKFIGKEAHNTFAYNSSKEDIATISSTGEIEAKALGETTITVSIPDTTFKLTFVITVANYDESTEIGKLLKLIVDNHNGMVDYGNVSLYDDGQTRYYDSMYGSVNNYLFDEYKVDTTYYTQAETVGTCHTTRRSTDQIEFVCVHDTATLTGTVVSIASGMSSATGDGASIHYTVGNDAIYGVVPEKLIAWHAGDGTGTVFNWYDSGVKAPTSGDIHPVYNMEKDSKDNWYLTINGTKSNILLPTSAIANPSMKYLAHLGPTFKVGDNGNYYIGTTWWSKSYATMSSRGGNNNSIGIEMCVNTSSDVMDTWQRTGQLVADILLRYNLDLTRVKMHNTFSGKNCPQCLIAGRYWPTFMKFVEVNYEVMSKYKDAKISIQSNNPDILDNTGRIYNPPMETTTVSYDLTVELNGVSKTVTLYSVVTGTTAWEQWDGRYSAKQIWNEGYYSLTNDSRNIPDWYNI